MMIHDRYRRIAGSGKMLGTCAAISDRTGLNANIVRVAMVGSALLISWKLTIVAYCAAAFVLWYKSR